LVNQRCPEMRGLGASRNGGQEKFCAGLGERLRADLVNQLRLLAQMSEKFIEFGFDTLSHAGEQQRD
jgi:hypothetical protein